MLILTRRIGEAIIINSNIIVRIMSILKYQGCRPQIKFGINAPLDVIIHREEVQKRVDAGMKHHKGQGIEITEERGNYYEGILDDFVISDSNK